MSQFEWDRFRSLLTVWLSLIVAADVSDPLQFSDFASRYQLVATLID